MSASPVRYRTDIEDIDLDDVPFAADVLPHFQPGFGYQHGEPRVDEVDLRALRGIGHAGYAERTWGELMPTGLVIDGAEERWRQTPSPLKRARENLLKLRENPAYYADAGEKPGWSFYELDGDYYLDMGAAHRTVFARAFYWLNGLPPIVRGVHVVKLERSAGVGNTQG